MTKDQLKTKINELPQKPGIYLFKNSKGRALYIGKALNLRNRVGHYLKTNDPRLTRMIKESSKIDVIKTESDIEALILESQYIKKNRPDFNIMLRDDKQYGFVTFTNDPFPKIFITHQPTKSQEFIGPFTDITALKTMLRVLRRIFPYCTCKQPHNNYCLNYHIEKCLGFCCSRFALREAQLANRGSSISQPNSQRIWEKSGLKNQQKLYEKNVKAIKDILNGKKNSLIKNLEKDMKKLAKEEKFEEAMNVQYKIEKIKRVFQNIQVLQDFTMIYHSEKSPIESLQKFLKLPTPPHRIEAYDIANIQGKHATGAMVVFENGKPNNSEYKKFKIRMLGSSTSKHTGGDTGMLKEILTRRFNHPEWKAPNLIIVDGGKPQLNVALAALNSKLETLNSRQIQNPKFKIQNKIPVIALAKDERHRGTKIYVAPRASRLQRPSEALREGGRPKELPLSKLPQDVKNLILKIDEEAHRFAINYYRKIHRGKMSK